MEPSTGWIIPVFIAVGLLIVVSIVLEGLRAQKRRRDGLTAAVHGRDVEGRWIHGTRDSRPWRLRIAERRHGGAQIEMIVPAQLAQTVEVHRRESMDRAAAALGLLQHRPTGERGFDDALIVLTSVEPASAPADSSALVSAEVRAALRRMVRDGLESFIWSTQDQAVVARWRSGDTPADNARQVAAVLALAEATTKPAPATGGEPAMQPAQAAQPAQADALGRRIVVETLAVIALFGYGAFAAMALDSTFTPLDRGPLLWAATLIAGLASLGWGWISWHARSRRTRDYRAWLPMMVLGFPAFWVVVYAAAVGINGAADNAAPPSGKGPGLAETREGDRPGEHAFPGRLGVPWRAPGHDRGSEDAGR